MQIIYQTRLTIVKLFMRNKKQFAISQWFRDWNLTGTSMHTSIQTNQKALKRLDQS